MWMVRFTGMLTKLGIWPERISSITLKSSTTGPSVTAISAELVLRPFYRPRREDRIFLLSRGLSIDYLQTGNYFFIHNFFFAFLSIFFSKSLSFLPQKILWLFPSHKLRVCNSYSRIGNSSLLITSLRSFLFDTIFW